MATIDDLIAKLQELIDLQKVSSDNAKATHDILMNPDLKIGGPYTAVGRWWQRQSTWKGFTRESLDRGIKKLGGTMGGRMVRRWMSRLAKSPFGQKFAALKRDVGRYGVFGWLGKQFGGKKGAQRGAAIGAKVGIAAAGATVVTTAFIAARQAIASWTDAALESARQLSEVSGSMAAVFAVKDMQDMLRDIRVGEATAGTAGVLARSEATRKDAESEVGAALTNVGNLVLAALNELVAVPLQVLAELARPLNQLINKYLHADEGAGAGIAATVEAMKADVAAAEARAGDLLAEMRLKALGFAGRDWAADRRDVPAPGAGRP